MLTGAVLTHHANQSGEPMPADLAVVSDDEDQDESGDPSDQRERNTRAGRRQKAPDMLTIPHREMLGNPYASLGGEGALTVLQQKTDLLLAHAGFDGESACLPSEIGVHLDLSCPLLL